jgi:uncharacterized protein (TIGR00725 family)
MNLRFSPGTQSVFVDEQRFDPWALALVAEDIPPADLVPIEPVEALRALHKGPAVRRVPVAIIGPKRANDDQCARAEALGRALGETGLQLLCGGKNGVMEAACKGYAATGGLAIGLLPDDEWEVANPYVAIPLAMGIGPARNALIARAAFALVAIGGEYGTLSEMAFGHHFDRLVIAFGEAPSVPGTVVCDRVEDVLAHVARRFFKLDSVASA